MLNVSFRSTERQTPIRSAEHFVMNATEEEARRGFAKVMSEFGEFLGHVDKALSISSARSKALTASMLK